MAYSFFNRKCIFQLKTCSSFSYYSTKSLGNKLNVHLNKTLVYGRKLKPDELDTQFVSIYGPDSIDFLNGMVTTKLKDKYVKKNLMTLDNDNEFKDEINVLDELKELSISNPLVGDILKIQGNDSLEQIKKLSLYDELQESYGNIKGQLTALLNSTSKIVSLMRLYTPLYMRRGSKYQEIILELPKTPLENTTSENDPISILDKHRKLCQVKFNVDVQQDPKLGFDVWEVYFKGSILRNDFELEILNHIFEDSKMNYLFNKQIHFTELFNQKNDSIVSIFLDDVFNNCSLVDSQDGQVYYKYKVLVKPGEVLDLKDIVNENVDIAFDQNIPSVVKSLEQKFGLYSLTDIKPDFLFPLDLALDYSANCVSFDKGCYIGQELTTRMHSTNKIIKRCVPIQIKSSNSQVTEGWGVHTDLPIKNEAAEGLKEHNNLSFFSTPSSPTKKRNKPIGKLVLYNPSKNIALVSLKIQYLRDFYYLGNPESRSFYLLPPKDKMSRKFDNNEHRVDISLNNPYWIEEYISELEDQEALEDEQFSEKQG